MRITVRVANAERRDEWVEVSATIDVQQPIASLPDFLARRLNLPRLEDAKPEASNSPWRSYAAFEHDDRQSIGSVTIAPKSRDVILGLSTLTGLGLELDRTTGELRKFEYLLL